MPQHVDLTVPLGIIISGRRSIPITEKITVHAKKRVPIVFNVKGACREVMKRDGTPIRHSDTDRRERAIINELRGCNLRITQDIQPYSNQDMLPIDFNTMRRIINDSKLSNDDIIDIAKRISKITTRVMENSGNFRIICDTLKEQEEPIEVINNKVKNVTVDRRKVYCSLKALNPTRSMNEFSPANIDIDLI